MGAAWSSPSLISLAAVAGLALVVMAHAQTPSPTPDPRPSEPPPYAFYCARPASERLRPELALPGALTVMLDATAAKVLVSVNDVPTGATCYGIALTQPQQVFMLFFEGSPAGAAPKAFEHPVPSSGRYCYQVLYGNPDGHSGFLPEVCVDVPESAAPTPTSTRPPPTQPVLPAPAAAPPNAGSGLETSQSETVHSSWLFIATILTPLLLGAAGVITRHWSAR